eukprot:1189180-Amphidinium_carterae.1
MSCGGVGVRLLVQCHVVKAVMMALWLAGCTVCTTSQRFYIHLVPPAPHRYDCRQRGRIQLNLRPCSPS